MLQRNRTSRALRTKKPLQASTRSGFLTVVRAEAYLAL